MLANAPSASRHPGFIPLQPLSYHAYQCLAMAFSHASFHTAKSGFASQRMSYCRWSVHLRATERESGAARAQCISAISRRVAQGPSVLLLLRRRLALLTW